MKLGFLSVAFLLACGPGGAVPPSTPRDDDSGATKMQVAEREILAALAVVDGRLEVRFATRPADDDLHKAATEIILSEDPSAALVEGRLDVFSFGARERALAKLKGRIPTGNFSREANLERELLVRLIDVEEMRVAQEKALPGAASELVRGLVAAWQPIADENALELRDAWLARRLGELEASLASPLPRDEQYELEDALDPLEGKIRAGYTDALPALAKLRIALGKAQPAPPIGWPVLSKRLAPHVGDVPPAEALMKRFEAVEKTLHPPQIPDDAAERAVKKLLLDPPSRCALEGKGVRGFGAPPERELACKVIAAFAKDDPAAPLAMHRVIVLAMTTLASHTGVASPINLRSLAPELSSRAGGRPIDFFVAALAIEWMKDRSYAKKWLAFGDAPLDVTFRELGAR